MTFGLFSGQGLAAATARSSRKSASCHYVQPDVMSPATEATGGLRSQVATDLLVSVVVPVRNAGNGLRELLACLDRQTLPRACFEVVIADDGSVDGCTEGVERPDGLVRLVTGAPVNSYAARNRGVAASRAPVLAFTDADCRPVPTWLEAGLAALGDADLVGGAIHFVAPARHTTWALLELDGYLDQESAVRRDRAATANLFVRRELFDRMGRFDTSFPNGGDYDFVSRSVAAGARLVFEPGAAIWHPTNEDAKPFLRKLWAQTRYNGARTGRRGGGPGVRTAGFWLPPLGMLHARRTMHPSLGLNLTRLEGYGVRPTRSERTRAVLAMYVVWPFVAWPARLYGWWHGRRSRATALSR